MAIKDLLKGKTAKEKANIKGVKIAKVVKLKKYKLNKKDGLWK